MNYPTRLKTRPRSTHTVYRFGGLWHDGEAPVGMTNGTTMRWEDMRNLTADRYPMMGSKKAGDLAVELDGNRVTYPIVGACSGEHLVLLDDMEQIWCNGHSALLGTRIDYDVAETDISTKNATIAISYAADSGTTAADLSAEFGDRARYITFTYDQDTHEWTGEAKYLAHTYTGDTGDLYVDFGLAFTVTGTLQTGDKVTLHVVPDYTYESYSWDTPRQLVRIGAWVVIWPEQYMVNAVKLAQGTAEVVDLRSKWQVAGVLSTIQVAPCDADGNVLSSVTVSATAPNVQSGYWMDTSGDKTVLREWSAGVSSWVIVPTTFVKISSYYFEHPAQEARGWSDLKAGDAAELSVDGDGVLINALLTQRQLDEIKQVLTGTHVLQAAGTGNGINEPTLWFVIPGIVSLDNITTVSPNNATWVTAKRNVPRLDYVTEAQNRLWGCYYGPNDDGEPLNEIYASKLGDPTNWNVYEGLSTDSWTASRGVPAKYTGAVTLDGHPLFFREESMEKVFPSSSGAHQIQTYNVDGVLDGAYRSMVIIDERLYYQSRLGICVYDGTLPRRISQAFGTLQYKDGVAGRYKKRYVISMTPVTEDGDGTRLSAAYDIQTGEWYPDEANWRGIAVTWKDELYATWSLSDHKIWKIYRDADSAVSPGDAAWYAESGVIGYELPEHRFISCIRIRARAGHVVGSTLTVKLAYDGGDWETKAQIHIPLTTGSKEINVFPRRCDHFKLRLEGSTYMEILSMSFRMERSGGGH